VRGVAEFSAILAVTLGLMDRSKQLTKLALFPLCDEYGVLIDTLCDTSDSQGTRADAQIFAWRLALPKGMDIGKAAEAVLLVATSIPRKAWSDRQMLIVRELMVIAGQKGPVPRVDKSGLPAQYAMRRARAVSAGRDAVELSQKTTDLMTVKPVAKSTVKPASKESKKWWKLVGRDPLDSNSRQSKTRE